MIKGHASGMKKVPDACFSAEIDLNCKKIKKIEKSACNLVDTVL